MDALALTVDRTKQERIKQECRGAKQRLRDAMKARRAAVTQQQRLEFAEGLLARFLSITPSHGAGRHSTALYAAKATEAAPSPLANVSSRIAFPRVAAPSTTKSELTFHWVASSALSPGHFGIREPLADAPLVAAGDLETIVLPGLAFDRHGARLGWGRGYYDRAVLQHPKALRVALAFSTQLVDAVPTEPWDIAVDFIITETGVIQCKPST